jgi:hypothetical protein
MLHTAASGARLRDGPMPPQPCKTVVMNRQREPIVVVLSYYTSTPNKYRYKASAIGEADALSEIYLSRDAVGDEPPRTIEVTVRAL